MRPPAVHRPGPAPDGEPPAALVKLANTLKHPEARSVGVSTTKDGRWALYVVVPARTDVPLPDLEAACGGFPVVYAAAPDKPARAY
jgi:hypothetical protein